MRIAPLVCPAFLGILLSAAAGAAPGDYITLPDGARFVDAEATLRATYGDDLQRVPAGEVSAALVRLAEGLPPGGAIHLPASVPCGRLDFRRVAEGVQITGGHGGTIILGGGQHAIQLLLSQLDQVIDAGLPRTTRPASALPPAVALAGLLTADDLNRGFGDVRLFDPKAAPATDLLAMFCEGSIQINHPVRHCAWIAGANAFGLRTVTATAPVDDSLFLWFGINWPFADYNAHLDPKNKGRDWLDHAQMDLDLKGGGRNTRMYLMVETNYGNPGPGVVLRNCRGLSLYHGSTERGSAQGPGIYWLKDCQDVKLGLRRVFCSVREGPKAAMPAHDITVEGGRGNVLQAIDFFGNAQQSTAVNSDPDLQAWSTAFDFQCDGFDGAGVLKYCFTPHLNRPEGKELEALRTKLPQMIGQKLQYLHLEDNAANRKILEDGFVSGRDGWYRLNARQETTFAYGGKDLTRGPADLPGGVKLPPPPSIPATDAPTLRRPLEFTQAPGFGKALLDAGADPTGQKPSDDAFARLMYGMTRDQLQARLDKAAKADADFRAARLKKDASAMQAAQRQINEVMELLDPPDPEKAKGWTGGRPPPRLKRPTLEIPPGTFLLRHPLYVIGGWYNLFGSGPGKTVLRADGDFKVIEKHNNGGTFLNFTVDGGRVGLAFTGADHGDPISPTLLSYTAGGTFYNITFRNQSFAGIHVGNDDPDLMGGAEHDQNRYVDLKFENTGQYGIYMNQNMLDKWLCLRNSFSGQKKAGIRIPFNNLIHGMIVGGSFKDIDGPGIDLMGGNPDILFRSHQVWVEQCDFTECGNADQPALDEGSGSTMALTRCRIRTKGKKIKAGVRSGASVYEDLDVDVETTGGAAVLLRAARFHQTARANGVTLRHVRSTGRVAFVNDANAYNDTFVKTAKAHAIDPRLNWDNDPAAHELSPADGWVHPFVFYDCDFGGGAFATQGPKHFAYTLINADPDHDKVLNEVDLSRLEK